jgi:hypothetical protein
MPTGLDDRSINEDGRIRQKNGATLLETLRETYPNLAPGRRADMKLDSLLAESGDSSLSEYRRNHPGE